MITGSRQLPPSNCTFDISHRFHALLLEKNMEIITNIIIKVRTMFEADGKIVYTLLQSHLLHMRHSLTGNLYNVSPAMHFRKYEFTVNSNISVN